MNESEKTLPSREEISGMIELFERQYYHELEAVRYLFQRANYFTVTLTALAYGYAHLFASLGKAFANGFIFFLLWGGALMGASFLVMGMACTVRFYFGYKYDEIPTLKIHEDYFVELEEYDIIKGRVAYVMGLCNINNMQTNERRGKLLKWVMGCISMSAACLIVSAVVVYIGKTF